MVGLKPDLKHVSFFSYNFLRAFLYALKFLFFAFIDDLGLLFTSQGLFRDLNLDEVL